MIELALVRIGMAAHTRTYVTQTQCHTQRSIHSHVSPLRVGSLISLARPMTNGVRRLSHHGAWGSQ